MANPHRGHVALVAGDVSYTLSFSVNALCELEDNIGLPIARIADELNDAENVRLSRVRAVLWAALLDHHPGMDLKTAGKIATEAGLPVCMDKIGEAFRLAFPDQEETGQARPLKAGA
jgi:hypothetical protein